MSFLVGGAFSLVGTATGSTLANANVQTVNVSDQSFTVYWTTPTAQTGSTILFGTSCASATRSVGEVPGNGYAHLVYSPGSLAANTTYYYKLVVGGVTDSNGGKCYSAKTYAPQTVPPPPATVGGYLRTGSACSTPVTGAVVFVTVIHNGVASAPLAVTSDSHGFYAIPFGDVTSASGQFVTKAKGDTIRIVAHGSAGKILGGSISYDGSSQVLHASNICG